MKPLHWFMLLLACTAAAFAVGGAKEKYRFEELQWQTTDSFVNTFTVWHDKESGIEFICAKSWNVVNGWNQPVSSPSISCFPTGRSWK